jgi:hypothetical protein
MLRAGYLEDWDYHETLSGCPQGGVVSPALSNVYLDKLDEFIKQELIPQYTRGEVRAANPAYRQVDALLRRARRRGDRADARRLAWKCGPSPRPTRWTPATGGCGISAMPMIIFWDSQGRRPKPRK